MSHSILTDRSKTDQSTETAAITKTSATTKLDQLPEVILRRIFEFLLSAKEVRQPAPANEGYIVKYHFHTAIMRVSKSIHFLAQGVFSLNHFILISTNCPNVVETIEFQQLQIWKRKLAKFKQYHVRLNMKSRFELPEEKLKNNFFLVCLDQIQEFTRILHMHVLMDEMEIAFKFEVKRCVAGSGSSLPVKRQHDLLIPFTKIQGMDQTCSVSGAVQSSLAKRVEMDMTPKLVWLRARAWAVYNAALHMKLRGDAAFKAKGFRSAELSWAAVTVFMDAVQDLEVNVLLTADANFQTSIVRLDLTTRCNLDLTSLQLARSNNYDGRYMDVLGPGPNNARLSSHPDMAKIGLAASQFFRGIAAFALRKPAMAQEFFTKAVRLAPNNDKYQQALDIVAQRHKTTKRGLKVQGQRQQELGTLFELLPSEALTSPIYLEAPVEREFGFEIYALEKLGYNGDKLTWLVEHAGHDLQESWGMMSIEDADVFVEGRKKDLKESDRTLVLGSKFAQEGASRTGFREDLYVRRNQTPVATPEWMSYVGY